MIKNTCEFCCIKGSEKQHQRRKYRNIRCNGEIDFKPVNEGICNFDKRKLRGVGVIRDQKYYSCHYKQKVPVNQEKEENNNSVFHKCSG